MLVVGVGWCVFVSPYVRFYDIFVYRAFGLPRLIVESDPVNRFMREQQVVLILILEAVFF
jgi:hypothetical protein